MNESDISNRNPFAGTGLSELRTRIGTPTQYPDGSLVCAKRIVGPGRGPTILFAQTKDPSGYWVGVPMRVRSSESPVPANGFLLLMSDSFITNQFFFDPKPW